ncbi:MAG: hypothetical protein K8R69_10505, partial [Deltaproteobacteria bacterium]|nr:hypothetical protein [Deltaproteobacteria bacterium]
MSPSTLNLAPGAFVRGRPEKTSPSTPVSAGQKILQELLQQKFLAGKSPSPGILAGIQDLKNESDEGLLFQGLLQIAQNLKTGEGEEIAQWIFVRLTATDSPAWVRSKAEAEKSTWTGGHFGMRAEYLLGRFCKDATDWRIIAPMMGASLAGRFVGTLALGRLSGAAPLGFGARLAAGTLGYAAEATAFAGLGRALSPGPGASFSADLARSALSLGALRLFGSLGQGGVRFLTPAGTAPGAPGFFASQVSGLLGLLTAHRLEEHLGLRPKVDGTTLFMDSFASLVSLGVGTRLGHGLAGEGYSRLQRGLDLRAHFSRPILDEFAVAMRRPVLAGKSPPNPWLMMSSNSNEDGGGKKGDSLAPVSLPSIVVDPSLYGDPYVGRVLNGRYKIEAVLGKGGGGKVYLATHEILGKKVAIKVLHEKMASDEEATERFLNEAKAVTAIGNPHIVDVNDFGEM